MLSYGPVCRASPQVGRDSLDLADFLERPKEPCVLRVGSWCPGCSGRRKLLVHDLRGCAAGSLESLLLSRLFCAFSGRGVVEPSPEHGEAHGAPGVGNAHMPLDDRRHPAKREGGGEWGTF